MNVHSITAVQFVISRVSLFLFPFFCDWLRHLSLNLWTVLSRSSHFWFWNLFKIGRESKVVVRLGSFLPLILLGKGTNIGDRECGSYYSLSVLCIYCVLILYLFHLFISFSVWFWLNTFNLEPYV